MLSRTVGHISRETSKVCGFYRMHLVEAANRHSKPWSGSELRFGVRDAQCYNQSINQFSLFRRKNKMGKYCQQYK